MCKSAWSQTHVQQQSGFFDLTLFTLHPALVYDQKVTKYLLLICDVSR